MSMIDLAQYYKLKREFFQKHDYSGLKTSLLVPLLLRIQPDKCYAWPTGFVLDQNLCRFSVLLLSKRGYLPPLVADFGLKAVRLARNNEEALTLWNDLPLKQAPILTVNEYLPLWTDIKGVPALVTTTLTAVCTSVCEDRQPAVAVLLDAEKVQRAWSEYRKQMIELVERKRRSIQASSIVKHLPPLNLRGKQTWAYVAYNKPRTLLVPLFRVRA